MNSIDPSLESIPLVRWSVMPPTLGAFLTFTITPLLLSLLAWKLPAHRQRLRTAAIWVPLVSGMSLFFPLTFSIFIAYISYKCMVEYRTILRQVYVRLFGEKVANDDWAVKVIGLLVGITGCFADLFLLVRVFVLLLLALLVLYAFRYGNNNYNNNNNNNNKKLDNNSNSSPSSSPSPKISLPTLFLLDFFGLLWSPFCLNVGAMTIGRTNCGSGLMVMFLWLSWFGDAGAYFVGKKIGRRKCFPFVSPGKTWEGVIAELVFYLLISFALYLCADVQWLQLPQLSLPRFILLGITLSLFGMCGDLVESLVKRVGGAKDSGDFFVGHGGCLDRFDSFFLASPVLFFGSGALFLSQ